MNLCVNSVLGGSGEKMAFTFGREKMIGRWLRVRPRSFFDWEKTEGVLTPEWYDKYTHEEGTPMLLEPATARNVSRAIKEINAFEWEGNFKPMARQALKDLLEKRLDEEMTQYLGVSHYEHANDRHDYRNGHYVRHLLTEMGDLELLVPRSRKGKFPTKLFARHARRCRSVDKVLLACFCLGLSTRKPPRCRSGAGREGLGLYDFTHHARFRLSKVISIWWLIWYEG